MWLEMTGGNTWALGFHGSNAGRASFIRVWPQSNRRYRWIICSANTTYFGNHFLFFLVPFTFTFAFATVRNVINYGWCWWCNPSSRKWKRFFQKVPQGQIFLSTSFEVGVRRAYKSWVLQDLFSETCLSLSGFLIKFSFLTIHLSCLSIDHQLIKNV